MTQNTARRRDAAGTRQALLDAARSRFATNGYAATTVRDIADEAGVNVALISRYFTSKEGLFEACLAGAADELGRAMPSKSLDDVPVAIARHLDSKTKDRLLLLLRSSGDAGADRIRRNVVQSFAERLSEAAGGGDQTLRAEIVLAAAFGMALLRTVIQVEPLASAEQDELIPPLRDLIDALLRSTPPAS